MSRKGLCYLYLSIVHVVFAGTAFYMLREQPVWILAVEVVVVVSFASWTR